MSKNRCLLMLKRILIFLTTIPRNNPKKINARLVGCCPLYYLIKKCPFFQIQCYFQVYLGKTMPKVPFFKDSGPFPKILDHTVQQSFSCCFQHLKSQSYSYFSNIILGVQNQEVTVQESATSFNPIFNKIFDHL